MTQARQAERSLPQAANFLPAALAVALILGVIAAFGMIAVPRIDLGSQDNGLSPAVVQSGQDWEAQRQQQSVGAGSAATTQAGPMDVHEAPAFQSSTTEDDGAEPNDVGGPTPR